LGKGDHDAKPLQSPIVAERKKRSGAKVQRRPEKKWVLADRSRGRREEWEEKLREKRTLHAVEDAMARISGGEVLPNDTPFVAGEVPGGQIRDER